MWKKKTITMEYKQQINLRIEEKKNPFIDLFNKQINYNNNKENQMIDINITYLISILEEICSIDDFEEWNTSAYYKKRLDVKINNIRNVFILDKVYDDDDLLRHYNNAVKYITTMR